MTAIIFLTMVPVFFGYVFLLSWPVWIAAYLCTSCLCGSISEQRKILRADRLRFSLATWKVLRRQKLIPWADITSSMELSSKTIDVANWMRKMGVVDVDNLKTDPASTFSQSYPDQYDLVTSISDNGKSNDLNPIYRSASGLLRKGGTFVGLENTPGHHSLFDHLCAARSHGFKLMERSDRPIDSGAKVSNEIWDPDMKDINQFMLVWAKV